MLSTLVEDLIAAGFSEKGIAQQIGLSQPSVHRIKRGVQKNVNFTAADALRKLHAQSVGKAAHQATDSEGQVA